MHVITGVTGQVGGATARRLLAAGLPVRAFVRHGGRASWREAGCDVAVVPDASDAERLAAAMAGADGVFLMNRPITTPSPAFPTRIGPPPPLPRPFLAPSRPGSCSCRRSEPR